jgi:hypothetical protein
VTRYEAGVATALTQWRPTPITGLWGLATDNVLAVDDLGQILRFDGSKWSTHPSGLASVTSTGSRRTIVDIWAAGSNDIWGVGDRRVAHFDGTAWRELGNDVDLYRSVWGSSSTDVWAVGAAIIGHWDGSTWTSTPEGGVWLEKVSGSSSASVWAVGHSAAAWGTGVILHWDGSSWKRADPTPATLPLFAVSALPDGEAWAVGDNVRPPNGATQSVILHFDGSTWQPQSLADRPTPWLRSVWAVSSGEVWAASSDVLRWDGASWSAVPSPPGLSLDAIWGDRTTGLWVAGFAGDLLRYRPGP